jgi:amidase
MDDQLCFRSATELHGMLGRREISAREVLEEHLAQVARWNPVVNAIATLTVERATEHAAALDEAVARGEPVMPLHGIPIAHKDLVDTAGVRTTYGSPIYADHVPDVDEPFVTRIREAGAVMIGKTNTPEWGAGSHTFNPVFGTTRNPYDPRASAGGSSGGAAAALATGMVPIADGSDLGGSLRNPASFCNVVGFRRSLAPDADELDLSVDGPMARTVEDVALLHGVMEGRAPFDVTPQRSARVAWAPTCADAFPVEPVVAEVIDATRQTFAELGCETTEAYPDLPGVRDVFFTLRAHGYAADLGELLAEHRDEIKPTVVWNIEQGLALDDADVLRAVEGMRALRAGARAFFERFDYLVQPVSQVPPFDAEIEYPAEVAGEAMETYLDWMASCWSITVLGGPAISVPAGFTDRGLPIGLQIVGVPGDDAGVLRLAHAFEQATGFGRIHPSTA